MLYSDAYRTGSFFGWGLIGEGSPKVLILTLPTHLMRIVKKNNSLGIPENNRLDKLETRYRTHLVFGSESRSTL